VAVPEKAVLGQRALNRALLARQLLLRRHALAPLAAIDHLVGLQAQAPNAPYVGLFARLAPFDADEVSRHVAERRLARTHAMRFTIHLLGAADCHALRPLLAPSLERRFATSPWARAVAGVDTEAVVAAGAELLAERPYTRAELGPLLAERFPPYDGLALAYTAIALHPTVQTPPRGIWRAGAPAAWTSMAAWLGEPAAPACSADDLVLRYLAAFGPATAADVRTWSGLTQLRAVIDRLRPQLEAFRDERGRERFDLPDAPRPDPETPAPPRFLPEYDNVLLSHDDRAHVLEPGRAIPLLPGDGGTRGTVLVDGFYRADWRLEREGDVATLHVEPFARLSRAEAEDVEEEGLRLLAFIADGVGRARVRIAAEPPG
jgi:hypothetical protein